MQGLANRMSGHSRSHSVNKPEHMKGRGIPKAYSSNNLSLLHLDLPEEFDISKIDDETMIKIEKLILEKKGALLHSKFIANKDGLKDNFFKNGPLVKKYLHYICHEEYESIHYKQSQRNQFLKEAIQANEATLKEQKIQITTNINILQEQELRIQAQSEQIKIQSELIKAHDNTKNTMLRHRSQSE